MLFTDALTVSQNDLARIDSEVPEIALSTQPVITITDVLNDTQQETGSQLLGMGGRATGRWTNMYNGPDYGPQTIFTESSNRPRYSLSQIVVSDNQYPGIWSELKRYLVYVGLYNFYRDASRRPGNQRDRYADKRDVYHEEIRGKYLSRLIKAGIPVVGKPLACPGAIFETTAGTWSAAANLSLVSGGTGGTSVAYDVAITWRDATAAQNNESGPSALATLTVPAGQQISVSIAALTGPNGSYPPASIARMPITPLTATHWNIYAAVSGGSLTLQNVSPIAYATKTYTLAIPAMSNGRPMGYGQYAEAYPTIQQNTFMRG